MNVCAIVLSYAWTQLLDCLPSVVLSFKVAINLSSPKLSCREFRLEGTLDAEEHFRDRRDLLRWAAAPALCTS